MHTQKPCFSSNSWYLESRNLLDKAAGRLLAGGLHLTVAESCTGGLVSKICTDIAGCSHWFSGGVVGYQNELKSALLGVQPPQLARHGAVSRWCVRRMAAGVLELIPSADIALAVSGVAGPGGGTPANPPGSVWLAAAARGRKAMLSDHRKFSGDRDEIRQQAALAGIRLTVRLLMDTKANPVAHCLTQLSERS